jgi:multidrug efflux pump subunit AcrB
LPKRTFFDKYGELCDDFWNCHHPKTTKGKLKTYLEFLATVWDITIKKFNRFFDKLRDNYIKGSKFYIERPKYIVATYLFLVVCLMGMLNCSDRAFCRPEDSGAVFTNMNLSRYIFS